MLVFLIQVLLIAGMSLGSVFLFRGLWKRPSRLRAASVNTSLCLFVCLYLFLASEAFFHFIHDQSDGVWLTISSQVWFKKHWHPINRHGYRDRDHSESDLAGKKVLFAVGDSFTAGQGVEDPGDRFPDLLQKALGEDWAVVTIAKRGWNTAGEFQALTEYPYTPDVVVLAYFVNDIEPVASQVGLSAPFNTRPRPPTGTLKRLLGFSRTVEFLFWFVRIRSADFNYTEYLESCYSNPAVWEAHQAELLQFVDYCEQHNAELILVVFPKFDDVEHSAPFTAQVAKFFEEHQVKAIDLAPRFVTRPRSELMASPLDAHPNEAVHAETAEAILRLLVDSKGAGVDMGPGP